MEARDEDVGYEIDTDRYDAANIFERTKCRVVAGGHTTIRGVHYEETYAPTARHDTLRVFPFMAAQLKNLILQEDAVSAYLAALQDTEVIPPEYWNQLFPHNKAFPGSRTRQMLHGRLLPLDISCARRCLRRHIRLLRLIKIDLAQRDRRG